MKSNSSITQVEQNKEIVGIKTENEGEKNIHLKFDKNETESTNNNIKIKNTKILKFNFKNNIHNSQNMNDNEINKFNMNDFSPQKNLNSGTSTINKNNISTLKEPNNDINSMKNTLRIKEIY